jgi:hypothetical protein
VLKKRLGDNAPHMVLNLTELYDNGRSKYADLFQFLDRDDETSMLAVQTVAHVRSTSEACYFHGALQVLTEVVVGMGAGLPANQSPFEFITGQLLRQYSQLFREDKWRRCHVLSVLDELAKEGVLTMVYDAEDARNQKKRKDKIKQLVIAACEETENNSSGANVRGGSSRKRKRRSE